MSNKSSPSTSPKNSPKKNPVDSSDLLAKLLGDDEDATRSIGLTESRYNTNFDMPMGMCDGPVEAAHVAHNYNPMKNMSLSKLTNQYAPQNFMPQPAKKQSHSTLQVHITQGYGDMAFEEEEFTLPAELSPVSLDMDPSQMMLEHSHDPNELYSLEEHEFNCKTAVISAKPAGDVKQAQAASLSILESSGQEISFTNEGYSFDVNYTFNHNHCSLEILLLETGDDHPTPNHIAIMYNKLNGDSYTFQRFYRESVAIMAKDLTDLRALNGSHLPTMEVMTDNFDRSDMSTNKGQIQQSLLQVVQTLQNVTRENVVEPMREATSVLVQLAEKHSTTVLEFLSQPQSVIGIRELLREKTKAEQICGYRDFAVFRNLLRMFNAVIQEEQMDFINKYKVCQHITSTSLFEIVCEAAMWWTQREGEVVGNATVICRDIGSFLMNVTRDFYGQNGWPASAESKASLKKISSLTAGGDFENFRKTVQSVLSMLN